MNTAKIYLYVKQFPLETNWKPAERPFYNLKYKVGREEELSGQDLSYHRTQKKKIFS